MIETIVAFVNENYCIPVINIYQKINISPKLALFTSLCMKHTLKHC